MREAWDEILKFENDRLEKRDSWKEKLKDLIDIYELWEDMDMNDNWDIEGIVEVESTEDKNPFYPNYEFGYIKDDKSHLFMKTDHEPSIILSEIIENLQNAVEQFQELELNLNGKTEDEKETK
jgi:hypothetical protein